MKHTTHQQPASGNQPTPRLGAKRNKTSPSGIEGTRQAHATQLSQVCTLLNWTAAKYCQHQYAMYETFISLVCKNYPAIATQLRYSAIFRGFFNNEWAIRNQAEFLAFANELTQDFYEVTNTGELLINEGLLFGNAYLTDEYKCIHNPHILLNSEAFMNKYNHILSLLRYEKY